MSNSSLIDKVKLCIKFTNLIILCVYSFWCTLLFFLAFVLFLYLSTLYIYLMFLSKCGQTVNSIHFLCNDNYCRMLSYVFNLTVGTASSEYRCSNTSDQSNVSVCLSFHIITCHTQAVRQCINTNSTNKPSDITLLLSFCIIFLWVCSFYLQSLSIMVVCNSSKMFRISRSRLLWWITVPGTSRYRKWYN